ncbi:MAG: hypothetical protein ACLQVN_08210 [Bryobacteraceae bacterium]
MKRTWMIALALLAGIRLDASEARPAADLRVPVCMDYQGKAAELGAAHLSMAIASGMFRRIGVTLAWVNSKSCPPEGIRIAVAGNTPAALHPGALAYATPYEGTHIRVFHDRIEANQPAVVPRLLAHVLVHETIHILEGCTRHSDHGLMKAHWDDVDLAQMVWSDLPIAPEDIYLVRLGIQLRAELATAHRNQDSMAGSPAATLAAPAAAATR